jgi:hypothetical protein
MKKKKERRVYLSRVLGSGQVMMPADLKRAFINTCARLVVSEDHPR